jgi:hypothetical protein
MLQGAQLTHRRDALTGTGMLAYAVPFVQSRRGLDAFLHALLRTGNKQRNHDKTYTLTNHAP